MRLMLGLRSSKLILTSSTNAKLNLKICINLVQRTTYVVFSVAKNNLYQMQQALKSHQLNCK
jgi:hypothetical protein